MNEPIKAISLNCQDMTKEDGNLRNIHEEKTIQQLIARMNRIEGQIRGIKGMIERHEYCDNVLNQISSTQSALDGVSKLILEKHMKSCVRERLEIGDTEVVDEVLKTVFRMIR